MDDNDKINALLKKISQLESSGGTNINHDLMQHGIHTGDRAIGQYGLMPNTIQEVARRNQMKDVLAIPKEELSSKFTPEMENQVARKLAELVLTRSKGDEEKAAYRWNMGHNMPSNRITPEALNQSNYIQKYRMLQQLLGKK